MEISKVDPPPCSNRGAISTLVYNFICNQYLVAVEMCKMDVSNALGGVYGVGKERPRSWAWIGYRADWSFLDRGRGGGILAVGWEGTVAIWDGTLSGA